MNKELIKKYAEIDASNEKEKEWEIKNLFDVIETDDGKLIGIYKTHITTSFCFSFDEVQDCECGTTTYNDANRMAGNVEFEYFLKQNLREIKIGNDDDIMLIYNSYYRKDIAYFGYKMNKWNELDKDCRLASENEIAKIKAVLEEQKKSVIKRCESWWKKYGKEKLHTWTYSIWD